MAKGKNKQYSQREHVLHTAHASDRMPTRRCRCSKATQPALRRSFNTAGVTQSAGAGVVATVQGGGSSKRPACR